jgi:hypothetical protein
MADPLWVARRIFDRYRPTPTGGDDRKSLESRSVDDTGKVAHPMVKRQLTAIAVGQPTSARVLPQKRELTECFKPGSPSEATPLVLEVCKPSRRHDQWRSAATRRIGKPHAVSSLAETDVLLHCARSGAASSLMLAQLGRKEGGAHLRRRYRFRHQVYHRLVALGRFC